MNVQDYMIKTAYDDLIESYTTQHSRVFLQAAWLLDENASFLTKSFSRMIFSEGNSYEIYTQRERDFITSIKSEVDYFCYQKHAKRTAIDCRMVSIDFSYSSDPLYDGIEFMKIFNKAFDGFNTFLFVCDNGILIGCSCIKGSGFNHDCMISPLITPIINWELLESELLCRNDSSDFYEYYLGMINMIYGIRNCFDFECNEEYQTFYLNNDIDDDPANRRYRIPIEECLSFKYIESPLKSCNRFDEAYFEAELDWCFDNLDFIKTSRVNSLELLFEAEKALKESNDAEQQYTNNTNAVLTALKQFGTNEDFKLLDDPIALMKKLKQERGI